MAATYGSPHPVRNLPQLIRPFDWSPALKGSAMLLFLFNAYRVFNVTNRHLLMGWTELQQEMRGVRQVEQFVGWAPPFQCRKKMLLFRLDQSRVTTHLKCAATVSPMRNCVEDERIDYAWYSSCVPCCAGRRVEDLKSGPVWLLFLVIFLSASLCHTTFSQISTYALFT